MCAIPRLSDLQFVYGILFSVCGGGEAGLLLEMAVEDLKVGEAALPGNLLDGVAFRGGQQESGAGNAPFLDVVQRGNSQMFPKEGEEIWTAYTGLMRKCFRREVPSGMPLNVLAGYAQGLRKHFLRGELAGGCN